MKIKNIWNHHLVFNFNHPILGPPWLPKDKDKGPAANGAKVLLTPGKGQNGPIHTILINGVLSVSFTPAITALQIDFMGPYKSTITGDHDVTPIWIELFHPKLWAGCFVGPTLGLGSCSRCLLGPPTANFLHPNISKPRVVEPTQLKNMKVKMAGASSPSFGGEHSKNIWVATTQQISEGTSFAQMTSGRNYHPLILQIPVWEQLGYKFVSKKVILLNP